MLSAYRDSRRQLSIPVFWVNAFTDKPFAGNPAAVCLLPSPQADDWMQNIAREMNLSETAFLLQTNEGFQLRWFTPETEVSLCGHATLASAHVLYTTGTLPKTEQARFFTQSGLLTAYRSEDWLHLNLPSEVPHPAELPAGVIEALGVKPLYTAKNRLDYLVVVDSEQAVREAKPDFTRLARASDRGVIVTSKATGEYDFISRYFDPAEGINEDPVTGSAHCCLGPYWRNVLGKDVFLAYQASKRGGTLHVTLINSRVALSGQAVTVCRGEIVA